jgi:hypothetical protein
MTFVTVWLVAGGLAFVSELVAETLRRRAGQPPTTLGPARLVLLLLLCLLLGPLPWLVSGYLTARLLLCRRSQRVTARRLMRKS